ncbi:MAG: N-6 DNA methylase [Planctomycetaceae bacterium]|jgi:type I restriction enzyme M protein|nr:N-6 DNA methylase [Planctomycetaceae bacterium]
MITLAEILNDSFYHLTQFSEDQIQKFEKAVVVRGAKEKTAYYIVCPIRKKEIKLTPEEVIRQLYIQKLITEYGYDAANFEIQSEVTMGSSGKRADIVVYEKERPAQPYIIVELKSPTNPTAKEGKKQLESYCKFSGVSIGVWTDGKDIECYYKEQDKKSKTTFLNKLTYLPRANQTLSEVLDIHYTIKQLYQNDSLEKKSLSDVIQEFEDRVMANSGEDSFDEIFKVLFIKLYDEYMSVNDADAMATLLRDNKKLEEINDKKFRQLEFRDTGSDSETQKRIDQLFDDACKQWKGIFDDNTKIKLKPSHLRSCVSYLQDIKLFNSNLEVVDDAFEYLSVQSAKGAKGQYFTPRYVIDMCVKMLNPKKDESMIDTAAGSCGFPMHTVLYVWGTINPDKSNLFTNTSRSKREINYVRDHIFAIDFDPRSVRVGRMLNIIAGDGHSNVLKLNTIDYTRWDEDIKNLDWQKNNNEGFQRFINYRKNPDDNKEFTFDILMANPPFAGDIEDKVIISCHGIARNAAGKKPSKIGRDILFIERNLDFLKDGGRMAIVLPQGRFNNSSDKQIREFIAERCRIMAVVGLHGNVFKPHTGTKTSVLFVQKWDDKLCPKCEDYPIFFATMQEPSKDNSGEKIYLRNRDLKKQNVKRPDEFVLDEHGHLIVKHDLFNHEGITSDGIAEAFIEFAKKEKLSFF